MTRLIIGCGYLGRRVANLWLAAGHKVAALTRTPQRAEELRVAGIEPVVGDVLNPDSLRALPPAETVLLAVGLDRTSGKSQREVYVQGLENVVRELRDRAGRWISISSTSVYGQTGGEWIDEDSPCHPTRSNGQVCLEAEQTFWRLLAERPQSPGHVLRLAGIYGPNRLLQRVATLKSGEPLSGNPDAWLNLIHVDDAAQIVLACEKQGTPGATYLVSDDRPIPRREYYELLARLAEAPPVRFAPLPVDSPDATDFNKRCANRRIRAELGIELRYPTIEQGLRHALQP